MEAWVSALRGDPRPWLLDRDDPAARQLALHWLEDAPTDDPEVAAARAAGMVAPPIAPILDGQDTEGWWVKPGAGYAPKYTGTTWSLIFLDQLGAASGVAVSTCWTTWPPRPAGSAARVRSRALHRRPP